MKQMRNWDALQVKCISALANLGILFNALPRSLQGTFLPEYNKTAAFLEEVQEILQEDAELDNG